MFKFNFNVIHCQADSLILKPKTALLQSGAKGCAKQLAKVSNLSLNPHLPQGPPKDSLMGRYNRFS